METVTAVESGQRTGEGVSPVKVQDFSKITSEPRAEKFLYYIRKGKPRRMSLRYRERI